MKKSTAINWVKVIAIIGWIAAAIYFIIGLLGVFGGTFVASLIPIFEEEGALAGLVGTAIIIVGIVMIALGIFLFFVARGLWQHQNWARIVMIVLSVIGIITALVSITSGVGVVGLIINAAIFYLLTFQKEVVALFK